MEATPQAVRTAVGLYPKTCAILVQNSGLLVWGNSYDEVQKRLEVIEHLCELHVTEFTIFNN